MTYSANRYSLDRYSYDQDQRQKGSRKDDLDRTIFCLTEFCKVFQDAYLLQDISKRDFCHSPEHRIYTRMTNDLINATYQISKRHSLPDSFHVGNEIINFQEIKFLRMGTRKHKYNAISDSQRYDFIHKTLPVLQKFVTETLVFGYGWDKDKFFKHGINVKRLSNFSRLDNEVRESKADGSYDEKCREYRIEFDQSDSMTTRESAIRSITGPSSIYEVINPIGNYQYVNHCDASHHYVNMSRFSRRQSERIEKDCCLQLCEVFRDARLIQNVPPHEFYGPGSRYEKKYQGAFAARKTDKHRMYTRMTNDLINVTHRILNDLPSSSEILNGGLNIGWSERDKGSIRNQVWKMRNKTTHYTYHAVQDRQRYDFIHKTLPMLEVAVSRRLVYGFDMSREDLISCGINIDSIPELKAALEESDRQHDAVRADNAEKDQTRNYHADRPARNVSDRSQNDMDFER